MSYELLTTESTVQVLSPSLVNDVVYCTLRSLPSGIVASIPVQADVFNKGQAGVELTNFSNAIEQINNLNSVVGGTGEQTIDKNGLTADNVAFVVQYVPPGNTPSEVTADALVPVGMLNFTDALIGQTLLAEVQAIIDTVYANLQEAAG